MRNLTIKLFFLKCCYRKLISYLFSLHSTFISHTVYEVVVWERGTNLHSQILKSVKSRRYNTDCCIVMPIIWRSISISVSTYIHHCIVLLHVMLIHNKCVIYTHVCLYKLTVLLCWNILCIWAMFVIFDNLRIHKIIIT